MTKPISHVMLDVDGVIIAGHNAQDELWTQHLKADLGIEPAELVQAFFAKGWSEVVTGRKALEPVLAESLKTLGSAVEPATLIDYWFAKDARLVASVVQDCERLRAAGLKVILTTNQEHRRAAYLMETLNLSRVVDGIVYSAQAGAQKPEPAFFEFAMDRTGQRPEAHLLIDDHAANVEGARRAGWHGTQWANGMNLYQTVKSLES